METSYTLGERLYKIYENINPYNRMIALNIILSLTCLSLFLAHLVFNKGKKNLKPVYILSLLGLGCTAVYAIESANFFLVYLIATVVVIVWGIVRLIKRQNRHWFGTHVFNLLMTLVVAGWINFLFLLVYTSLNIGN